MVEIGNLFKRMFILKIFMVFVVQILLHTYNILCFFFYGLLIKSLKIPPQSNVFILKMKTHLKIWNLWNLMCALWISIIFLHICRSVAIAT